MSNRHNRQSGIGHRSSRVQRSSVRSHFRQGRCQMGQVVAQGRRNNDPRLQFSPSSTRGLPRLGMGYTRRLRSLQSWQSVSDELSLTRRLIYVVYCLFVNTIWMRNSFLEYCWNFFLLFFFWKSKNFRNYFFNISINLLDLNHSPCLLVSTESDMTF